MLKVLVGVGLGFLLFQSPEARKVTAGVFRSAADLLDPPPENIQEVVKEAVQEVVR